MGGARNAGKGLKGKGLGGSLAKRAQRHGAHVGHVAQTGYINYGTGDAGRHTTDVNPDGGGGRGGRPNLTSVMERNDMDEFFALADLANRDFTTERSKARVLSMPGGGNASGVANNVAEDAHAAADAAAQAEARADAEALHSDSLKVPRRPPWTKDMSVDQLDRNEKAAFLEWRRALAAVEEDERLTLTPFEKNLEIWRQLWRVCERSDIVVQVVDARDPLFYRCPDLEAYVTEIDAAKRTLLLLNKADLLSPELRRAWCDYFDERRIGYLWWSAKTATEAVDAEAARMKKRRAAEEAERAAAFGDLPDDLRGPSHDDDENNSDDDDFGSDSDFGSEEELEPVALRRRPRAREDILSREQLLEVLERRAEEAAGEGARLRRRDGRVCVGMVGYPNVGKSSTVNALVAAKKTGVSATPGKTKHFQTLELGTGLLLADCPGLVFPSFTASRAELVCNGVLPIDRLTDVREPVGIVASRISRRILEATYHFKLPLPALHEDQSRNATAGELLRAYCAARRLTVQQGRPDEQRAGRAILKDFINGKLLHCVGPDGYTGEMGVLGDAIKVAIMDASSGERANHRLVGDDGVFNDGGFPSGHDDVDDNEDDDDDVDDDVDAAPDDPLAAQLLEEMMNELGGIGKSTAPAKPKRAEHKFQKKGAKIKGRIKNATAGVDTTAGGQGFKMGKRGGLMPASAQAMIRSSKDAEA